MVACYELLMHNPRALPLLLAGLPLPLLLLLFTACASLLLLLLLACWLADLLLLLPVPTCRLIPALVAAGSSSVTRMPAPTRMVNFCLSTASTCSSSSKSKQLNLNLRHH
jgi:hypothetical protein